MLVTIFIDESGTHNSPVTVMAGCVGRLGQWARFDVKWKRLLKRNNLSFFHSTEFRNRHGEFKNWSHKQKADFIRDARKIAFGNLAFWFVVSLFYHDYKEYYIDDNRPKKIPLDSRWGLCSRYCLSRIPHLAKNSFQNKELEISFVLESGNKNNGDAERIFNEVKNARNPNEQTVEVIKMLKTISFGDKKEFPGLQMADIHAYFGFQHNTRLPFDTVQLELNSSIVEKAKKIQPMPIFNLHLTEQELRQLKNRKLQEAKERQDYGLRKQMT